MTEELENLLSGMWGNSFTPEDAHYFCMIRGYIDLRCDDVREKFAQWDKEFNDWCERTQGENHV